MKTNSFSSAQTAGLVLMRLLIGWHFLYEGVIKLYNPSWTAKGYLLSAELLKPFFAFLASDSVIRIVDTLNIVALIGIGISLLLGLKTRWGSVAGIVLLAFYYLAHPALPGFVQGPAEGSYWIVNKNLIEMAALYVIYQFPTSMTFGLERFSAKAKAVRAAHE